MKVTMMLCDSAQVAEGKLFILGGGWSVTGPDPTPSAIAVKLDVDWHEADRPHHWELYLENADGQMVTVPTPEGDQPVEVRGDFQVGRPQGVPEGTPIDLPLAVNFGPIPLPVASRFTWRFTIDGVADQDWRLGFTTRPAADAA